jgi:hypothetical protein
MGGGAKEPDETYCDVSNGFLNTTEVNRTFFKVKNKSLPIILFFSLARFQDSKRVFCKDFCTNAVKVWTEVLTAVSMMMAVFWVASQCGPVEVYRRFRYRRWCWRQDGPLKRWWNSTRPHGDATQKRVHLMPLKLTSWTQIASSLLWLQEPATGLYSEPVESSRCSQLLLL